MSTRRITRNALLATVALIIFVIEAQLPPIAPIPGIKLGLANIVTVYAMFQVGPRDTFWILLVRILLGSVFAGQLMALFFSLAGGFLCYLAMLLLYQFLTEKQIWVCGVIGAICHNIGQILVAMAVLRTTAVALYLPVLLLSAIVTGLFTGVIAQLVYARMKKIRLD